MLISEFFTCPDSILDQSSLHSFRMRSGAGVLAAVRSGKLSLVFRPCSVYRVGGSMARKFVAGEHAIRFGAPAGAAMECRVLCPV